jgi:hypothetical protein
LQGATDIESSTLVLTVDQVGLENLVHQLESTDPAVINVEPAPSGEAMGPITRLDLRSGEGGLLLVTVDGEVATITGSHDNFRALADDLKRFEQENDLPSPGMHIHFDPSEQQFRRLEMSSDSAELIVTGPIPDE